MIIALVNVVRHFLSTHTAFRALIDSSRRLHLLARFHPEIGSARSLSQWGTVPAGPDGETTRTVTVPFRVAIDRLSCMQARHERKAFPKTSCRISGKDLLYFSGSSRTKDFYSLQDTISWSEIAGAMRSDEELTSYLSTVTRFGASWVNDRQRRTRYLLDNPPAPESWGQPAIVDVIGEGFLVLQDGHHRAAICAMRGDTHLWVCVRA